MNLWQAIRYGMQTSLKEQGRRLQPSGLCRSENDDMEQNNGKRFSCDGRMKTLE